MRRVDRERSSNKSPSALKSEQIENLAGKVQALRLERKELRRKLKPDDADDALRLMASLAERALRLNTTPEREAGLDAIVRLAQQLLRGRAGELERHRDIHAAVAGINGQAAASAVLVGAIESVVKDATECEASDEARGYVRGGLRALVPGRVAADEAIDAVVTAYRSASGKRIGAMHGLLVDLRLLSRTSAPSDLKKLLQRGRKTLADRRAAAGTR